MRRRPLRNPIRVFLTGPASGPPRTPLVRPHSVAALMVTGEECRDHRDLRRSPSRVGAPRVPAASGTLGPAVIATAQNSELDSRTTTPRVREFTEEDRRPRCPVAWTLCPPGRTDRADALSSSPGHSRCHVQFTCTSPFGPRTPPDGHRSFPSSGAGGSTPPPLGGSAPRRSAAGALPATGVGVRSAASVRHCRPSIVPGSECGSVSSRAPPRTSATPPPTLSRSLVAVARRGRAARSRVSAPSHRLTPPPPRAGVSTEEWAT